MIACFLVSDWLWSSFFGGSKLVRFFFPYIFKENQYILLIFIILTTIWHNLRKKFLEKWKEKDQLIYQNHFRNHSYFSWYWKMTWKVLKKYNNSSRNSIIQLTLDCFYRASKRESVLFQTIKFCKLSWELLSGLSPTHYTLLVLIDICLV